MKCKCNLYVKCLLLCMQQIYPKNIVVIAKKNLLLLLNIFSLIL